ncbi:MAG: hypothetical protein PHH49_03390 [Candidatus Omnitrophica bacterium]|nr:hypothetical protein [Candidatus Omnitrophota bacterium]MDD5487992.1 hypothetical protein [Candidatus Omnitrophota bacterium]
MNNKKYQHRCEFGREDKYFKRNRKRRDTIHERVFSKSLHDIYNRYYKEQVAALYRSLEQ